MTRGGTEIRSIVGRPSLANPNAVATSRNGTTPATSHVRSTASGASAIATRNSQGSVGAT